MPEYAESMSGGGQAKKGRSGSSQRYGQSSETFLTGYTLYRLSVANVLAEKILVERLQSEIGLSLAEWRLMLIVGKSPGLSTDAVATQTTMDKSKVSRAIARLTALGLVDRKVHDEDKRLNALSITARGAGIFDRCVKIADTAQEELLGCLTAPERKRLHKLLVKLQEPYRR